MQLTRLAEAFCSLGYPAVEGEPMSNHTSFQIGGPADLFVTVPDGEGAAVILSACGAAGVRVWVLGNVRNLWVCAVGIYGGVINI